MQPVTMNVSSLLNAVHTSLKEQTFSVIEPKRLVSKLSVFVMLVMSLLFSAFAVVYASHKHRLAFDEFQTSMREKDGLETEWRQLLLEQNTWGASARVERMAKERIGMQVPEYTTIEFVKHDH